MLTVVRAVLADESVLRIPDGFDPYSTLGLEKGASDAALRKAYRRLALRYHPDKNDHFEPGRFERISLAYEVLADPTKRRIFDDFGGKGFQTRWEWEQSRTGGPTAPAGLYSRRSSVEVWSEAGHPSTRGRVHVIKFYAPWCVHCQHLAPAFSQAALEMLEMDNVTFAAIDCEAHPHTCERHGIRGYPTVRALGTAGRQEDMPPGPHTGDFVRDWVMQVVNDPVRAVTAGSMAPLLLLPGGLRRPMLLDFVVDGCGSICGGFRPLFRRAAEAAGALVDFGLVNCEHSGGRRVCDEVGPRHFPFLWIVPRGATSVSQGWPVQTSQHQAAAAAAEIMEAVFRALNPHRGAPSESN